ncbi:MAG: DUF4129 domain-containing protein [Cyanobacteria bacterium P01_D01_bin.105]
MFVFMLEGYRTSSLSWQAGQLVRRFREWLEYRLSQLDIDGPDLPKLPDWSIPEIVQQLLFWGLIIALGAWLAFLLYRALEQPIRDWLERTQGWTTLGDRPQTLGQDRSAQYWWQQAQTLAKQGNYTDACKALYRATLQQLHDGQIVSHDASRTDGEYLVGIGRSIQTSVPRPYQLLIGTHERLVFGVAEASGEMFKRCSLAYQALQRTRIQQPDSQQPDSQK